LTLTALFRDEQRTRN